MTAPAPTRCITALLTVTCAVTSSNIYLLQPLLGQVAHDFGASQTDAGRCATLIQVGYAAGILLLVPLGDRVNRRPLILTMMTLTTIALVCVAVSPTITWLAVAATALGFLTPIPQVVLPLGVALAGHQPGRIVGTLQAGLLVGLLASRSYAGLLGQFASWRLVYWCSAALMIFTTVALKAKLPSMPGADTALRYPALLRSLSVMLFGNVRVAGVCLSGALIGCAFGAFWNTLSFVLAGEFGFGPAVIGLFGLVAATSATTSPLAGRLADRWGVRRSQLMLICTVATGWIVLLINPHAVGSFVAGTVLLDVGVWGNQVVNQATLFQSDPAIHNRLNTLYFVTRFLGIAAGSALGIQLWSVAGWPAVATGGLLAALLALPIALFAAGTRGTGGDLDRGGHERGDQRPTILLVPGEHEAAGRCVGHRDAGQAGRDRLDQ
ncbi:MFS transporter [Amycolatopsis rhizosphaerae]|uniref:MFS transporter n=1 Tax=Amycolatopsis rhizosphaerae TaxID=2053003 RepID=A0A558DNU2_9PSEU|nr:MFS transporter [Amycolatopsis rhizosphaerae]